MYEISLIIPVYNVEKYLKKCLDSVASQTYKDFELILVDDGSTDRSGIMCDEYANSYLNAKVIHQRNAGLSEARNAGVEKSSGKYIIFIDSDDYVLNDYVEVLYNLIKKNDADIAVAKMLIVYKDYNSVNKQKDIKEEIFTPEKALEEMMYEKKFICTAWNKIFRSELIKKYKFPKNMLYEDLAVMYKIFGESQKVIYTNKILYFWRHRKNSITKTTITDKHLDSLNIAEEQINYINNNYPKIIKASYCNYVARIVSKLSSLSYEKDKRIFKDLKEKCEKYLTEVLKDNNARLDIKIRAFSMRFGFLFSYLLIHIIEKIKPFRSKIILNKNFR